ncbi:4999_t:CDS:1, partial [Cetraspora pellucida]
EEFEICNKLVIILRPFNEVTEILGGLKYSTLGVIVPEIKKLKHLLSVYETESLIINQVKNIILENIKKQ